MKHVRDIQCPRVGKYVCFHDAVTLEPFTGTVTDRTGKTGSPIVEAADGSEREFVFKRGDRLQRIASKPWGVHAVKAVDHTQATRAIARAERKARLSMALAATLAAASLALVGAVVIYGGLAPH